jgi:hypothetical protein
MPALGYNNTVERPGRCNNCAGIALSTQSVVMLRNGAALNTVSRLTCCGSICGTGSSRVMICGSPAHRVNDGHPCSGGQIIGDNRVQVG